MSVHPSSAKKLRYRERLWPDRALERNRDAFGPGDAVARTTWAGEGRWSPPGNETHGGVNGAIRPTIWRRTLFAGHFMFGQDWIARRRCDPGNAQLPAESVSSASLVSCKSLCRQDLRRMMSPHPALSKAFASASIRRACAASAKRAG